MDFDLYPVITPGFTRGRSHLFVLNGVLKGGAKIVQLRDKEDPARHADNFRKLTKMFNALLIINDSLEVALKCGADGVHLGQKDMPVKEAKKLAPQLIVGASATTLKEALQAESDGADYIGVGPIFSTLTKNDAGPVIGLEILKEIKQRIEVPIVAIGGVNSQNIRSILDLGINKIALISALTEAEDVEATARQFIQLIRQT